MNLAAATALGYALGSVPFAFLVARAYRGLDIRSAGSGNVGATNVLRAIGPGAALATAVLDVAKGAAPVLIAEGVGGGPEAVAAAGLSAVVGHVYPVWLRFRGGKGVAATFGACLAWSPPVAGIALAVFAAAVATTRIVSVASLAAAVAAVPAALLLGVPRPAVWALSGASLLIVFRHRGNMRRVAAGTEPRITERERR